MTTTRLTQALTAGATTVAAALPAGQALAQDATSALAGMDLTVDGGFSIADFSEQTLLDKGAPPDLDVGSDSGFYGSLALSRQISDQWDWRVSATAFGFGENSFRDPSGPDDDDDDDDDDDGVTITQSLSALQLGATAGYRLQTGATDVRLGFGLLSARYSQDLDNQVRFGGKGFGFQTEIDYRGFGALLSADMEHPLSADGRTRLIGGASVAPTSGEFEFSSTGEDSDFADGDAMLTSAYLGLAMQQNPNTVLRMGVRLDRYDSDLDDGSEGLGIAGGSFTTTTAFVGLKVDF